MKALNLYGIKDVRYEEVYNPVVEKENDVLIKVHTAGICGSDISRFGKIGSYNPGLTWGHEFSGTVVATGNGVTTVKSGDRVTACNCFPCFQCDYCKQGKYARCTDLKVLGGHKKGAFAEYIVMPAENVLKLPELMDFDTASFIEPSSVVVHGMWQVDIKAGSSVAIVGCGTIGLLAVQWAKICGAGEVYAFDTDKEKLAIAEKTGATATFCVQDDDHLALFQQKSFNAGVDVVFESSGNAAGIASSLLLAAKGGSIVLLGIPYGNVALPRLNFEKIVRNELKVIGSWNSISAPFPGKEWQTSIHYLSTGQIDVAPLITKKIPLSDVPSVLPALFNREEFFVKVLINVNEPS